MKLSGLVKTDMGAKLVTRHSHVRIDRVYDGKKLFPDWNFENVKILVKFNCT
jgi:hypothetical protein